MKCCENLMSKLSCKRHWHQSDFGKYYKCEIMYFFFFACTDGDLVSEMAVRSNAAVLEYTRTSVSALSGGTAGILGLTGLYGFAFYFIFSLIMSVSIFNLQSVTIIFSAEQIVLISIYNVV